MTGPSQAGILKCLLLAIALLGLAAAKASAGVVTFTHEGTGSGTLDGTPFPASDFVITAFGATDDRYSFPSGWSINHTSMSISIDGVGDFEILTGTRTFVNNSNQTVGFSRGGGESDLFNGPTDAVFGTWDMLGPIGPISGPGSLLQWSSSPQIDTTGGILLFDSGSSDATFTAVPEPNAFSLLTLGGLLATRRRRWPSQQPQHTTSRSTTGAACFLSAARHTPGTAPTCCR